MSFSAPADLKAVAFDLDDTLAASKSAMDPAMSAALARLLERTSVCIISGGRFEQFEAQALSNFSASDEATSRLHLMPTCGTRYYLWQRGEWVMQYAEDLTVDEKARTVSTLEAGARELGLWHPGAWGDIIEDRGSQITFSALGQQAPVEAKMAPARSRSPRGWLNLDRCHAQRNRQGVRYPPIPRHARNRRRQPSLRR
jgi:phosphomannomutase